MINELLKLFTGLVLIFSFIAALFSGILSVIFKLINHIESYVLYRLIFMRSISAFIFAIAAYLLIYGVYEQIEWRNVNGVDGLKMVVSILFAIFFATIALAIYKMA